MITKKSQSFLRRRPITTIFTVSKQMFTIACALMKPVAIQQNVLSITEMRRFLIEASNWREWQFNFVSMLRKM